MMLQSTSSRSHPAQRAAEICLVMAATPASHWERVLPLLEHAGCTCPDIALMQRWVTAAHESIPIGRPGIATLQPTPLNSALRAATEELIGACAPPVAIAIDGDDPEMLTDFWERDIPGTHLLLLHARPERALIEAMRSGADPVPVLERWMAAGARALDVYRRNRSRIALLDVDCVLAAPGDFVETWAALVGSDAGGDIPEPTSIPTMATDVTHLIAAQMVVQSREARRLIAELEACSLPIGEPAEPAAVDCGRIFRDLQEEQAWLEEAVRERDQAVAALDEAQTMLRAREETLPETEAKIEEARKENELLLLQLHQVQEELEATFLEKQKLGETSAAETAERERLQVQIETLTASRDEQERRIVELTDARERQSKVVSELEKRIAQVEEARDQQAKLAAGTEVEFGQLKQMHESLEARHKEASQENELLLLQLHQVQEELESYYLQLQSTSEKLKTTDKKISDRDKKLRYMENSRSWKMTAPMRAILKIFVRRPARGKGKQA